MTSRNSRGSWAGTSISGSRNRCPGRRRTTSPVTDQRSFDRPILAFGMPRSGTTWLGKILDSHPQTLYRHEPDTWRRLESVPLFAVPEQVSELREAVRDFLASLPDMLADRVCGKRPIFPKTYASPLAVRVYATRSLLHKALGRVGWTTRAPLPAQPATGAPYRIAMKSIESLGRAGLFAACLPEARFVHIVRHPCGYVASVLRGEQQTLRRRFDSLDPGITPDGVRAPGIGLDVKARAPLPATNPRRPVPFPASGLAA